VSTPPTPDESQWSEASVSKKAFGEPVPVAGGGIAPSGAEPRDIPLLQLIKKPIGRLVTHLPVPLLQLLLRGMRQERPPRAIGARVEVTRSSHAGVAVTWLAHHDHRAGVVVYLPGGLYMAGPVAPQWKWLAEIQRRTGLAAATVCYRKPPEHPHPAALDDAAAVIESLHRSGELTEGRWVLAGDSAGGHLALAACQRLRDIGGPMPGPDRRTVGSTRYRRHP
jgi:acetyl esterase/lipase